MTGSEPLQNRKHEAFALLVAGGASAASAYKRQVAAKTTGKDTIETKGPELARTGQVSVRIKWLRQEAAKLARSMAAAEIESNALTVAEKRKFLADVIRTPINKVTGYSTLAQSLRTSESGTEIKMPCKLRAIQIDNDLAGDGEAAKGQTTIAEALASIMGVRR